MAYVVCHGSDCSYRLIRVPAVKPINRVYGVLRGNIDSMKQWGRPAA